MTAASPGGYCLKLYCRDVDVDRAYVRDAQLSAADLEPVRAGARRVKLAAILR